MSVSVIVPTRNSARSLERCLRSVRHQGGAKVQIVVVDNGSTDDTVLIAQREADLVVAGGPERSAQRNIGAHMATGDVLLFVDDDMILEPGIAAELSELVNCGAPAVVVPERSYGEGFWARCKALEKLLVLDDPAVEAARGFSRSSFEAVGGYDERLTAAEDWDLADRVTQGLTPPVARTRAVIWHDEGQLRLRGTFSKKRYYGRWIETWNTAAPEHRRHRAVSRMLPQLVSQPVTATGLVIMKLVEVTGFALGMRDARKADS
jgi:glycosyltransferase involved in cell wall biosynthesis